MHGAHPDWLLANGFVHRPPVEPKSGPTVVNQNRAGRRAERLGRFPSSRPLTNLRSLRRRR